MSDAFSVLTEYAIGYKRGLQLTYDLKSYFDKQVSRKGLLMSTGYFGGLTTRAITMLLWSF